MMLTVEDSLPIRRISKVDFSVVSIPKFSCSFFSVLFGLVFFADGNVGDRTATCFMTLSANELAIVHDYT
jgi:hypothetical protein